MIEIQGQERKTKNQLLSCSHYYHVLNITQQFVSRSLDDVKNEEWLIEVGSAMGEKELVLERYMNYPEEKVRHCHPMASLIMVV